MDFQRRLELEGAPNVRDLGGYRSSFGGITRWGRLFRAGRLSALSERDQQQLAQYRIATICDFRREEEYQTDVTDLGPRAEALVHNLAISPGAQSYALEDLGNMVLTADDMANWMIAINRELALHQTDTYRRMFELLLSTEADRGFLFHCSAGKDRTGFAAAIILAALGVSRDTIMEDYLLTAQYYPPANELEYLAQKYSPKTEGEIDYSVFQALMESREQYLGAALEAIDENFDSIDHYLESALGLTDKHRDELVARYIISNDLD